MELGARFRSYEEFKERFRAYQRAHGSRYGLRSCVSVRFHNREYGTAIRDDVMFMQVKFGCTRMQKYSKKRKQQPSLCPAYFVLQYNEDIDQLVITELHSNHVHLDPASARDAARGGGPAAKLCRQQRGEAEGCEALGESSPGAEQLLDGASALGGVPALPEAEKENDSASAAARVTEVVKNCLNTDRGALASVDLGSDQGLERLSFQTSKMKSLFVKFPDSLLLHRVQSKRGHVLYVLFVESKERVGKVVHWSVLGADTGQSVSKMLAVFKEFNPEWWKVRVVFVDASFPHKAVLHELFPSAQVLLSVYHTVRLLEEKLNAAEMPSGAKYKMKLALTRAVFFTSAASLGSLSQLVKTVVKPELYDFLQANWFSCELLWYMHAKKGLHSCSAHIDSLDLVTKQIAALFGQQLSLEASVLRLLECADCFDSKPPDSSSRALSCSREAQSGCQETPEAQVGAAAEPAPPVVSPALTKRPEPPTQPPEGAGCMLAVLHGGCTALGSRLCAGEWEVVQMSTQLISTAQGGVDVRLLEDTHQVSADCGRCSCFFQQRYRLPCRHVLAVLHACRGRVEATMVGRRWQQRFHPCCVGPSASDRPVGSCAEAEGRLERIQALSKELANLLLQSDGAQLEERGAALRAIADAWAEAGEERAAAPRVKREAEDGPLP